MFTIDEDLNVIYYPEAENVPDREGMKLFSTRSEFLALVEGQTGPQLATLWNTFAGSGVFEDLKPVKGFTHSLQVAKDRIWNALQRLDGKEHPAETTEQEETVSKPKVRKARKVRAKAEKKPMAKPKAAGKGKRTPKPAGEPGGKKAAVIALISRKGGATVHEIMEKLGWATHTVRGCVSRLNSSNEFHTKTEKTDRGRTYFAA